MSHQVLKYHPELCPPKKMNRSNTINLSDLGGQLMLWGRDVHNVVGPGRSDLPGIQETILSGLAAGKFGRHSNSRHSLTGDDLNILTARSNMAMENPPLSLKMAIEIVSFPINSMVFFHSYVSHYQRVYKYECFLKLETCIFFVDFTACHVWWTFGATNIDCEVDVPSGYD